LLPSCVLLISPVRIDASSDGFAGASSGGGSEGAVEAPFD
jgi:hypothetical protein